LIGINYLKNTRRTSKRGSSPSQEKEERMKERRKEWLKEGSEGWRVGKQERKGRRMKGKANRRRGGVENGVQRKELTMEKKY
jgi:hypothetical protein